MEQETPLPGVLEKTEKIFSLSDHASKQDNGRGKAQPGLNDDGRRRGSAIMSYGHNPGVKRN
jgi:hypothetical protein